MIHSSNELRNYRKYRGGKVNCNRQSIRDIRNIRKQFGPGRWRKLKGIATVHLFDGTIRKAEIHWYEAHGVGKRKFKIKSFLD